MKEADLRRVFDSMTEAYYRVDNENRIITVNRTAMKMFGYDSIKSTASRIGMQGYVVVIL